MAQQEFNYSQFTGFTADELAEQMKSPKKTGVVREMSEKGRAYLEFLKSAQSVPDKSIEGIIQKINIEEFKKRPQLVQKMTYENAKVVLWAIIKLRLEKEGLTFTANDNEIFILQNLLKYFICDPTSVYELHKGVLITGSTGVGKTFLMECFKTFVDKTGCRPPFQTVKTSDLADAVKVAADSKSASAIKVRDKYKTGGWFFDDLGDDEALEIVDYGNKITIMENILKKRESDFCKNSTNGTYITTNLLPTDYEIVQDGKVVTVKDEIATRYGDRLRSRMQKWFNFILWDGKDKRYL